MKFQKTKVCLEKGELKIVYNGFHLFLCDLSCFLMLYGCRVRLLILESLQYFTVGDMKSVKATHVPILILKYRLACGIFCVSTRWLFICPSQSLNLHIYGQC